MSPGKLFKLIVKLGLITGLFVTIVLLSSFLIVRVLLRPGEVVEVPNIHGDSFSDAWDKLAEAGLRMKADKGKKQYNPLVPKGHVIATRPTAGSKVKKGRVVEVVISKGSEMLSVPDVTGSHLRQAKIALTASRLDVGNVSTIHFAAKQKIVLAQDPRPKSPIEVEGKVNLLVSAGPRRVKYLVPNVLGMKLDEAIQVLAQLNFETLPEYEVRAREEPDVVLAQDPQPNEILEEGKLVKLIASAPTQEPRRWENLRHVIVAYQVPDGFSPQPARGVPRGFFQTRVRVDVTDENGTETLLDRDFDPGQIITIPVWYKGEVTVKVFEDGALVQETSANASAEQTIHFIRPTRIELRRHDREN